MNDAPCALCPGGGVLTFVPGTDLPLCDRHWDWWFDRYGPFSNLTPPCAAHLNRPPCDCGIECACTPTRKDAS